MSWTELEVPIKDIKKLILDGIEVEIDSPDGWVKIDAYVEKGEWEEYVIFDEEDNKVLSCNESHLFETPDGWVFASSMNNGHEWDVISSNGVKKVRAEMSGKRIPIVDIQVNHANHRYFANGLSSHNTNVGKSLMMCHFAANNLIDGKNVLYITLEMSHDEIAKRIEANLLNMPVNDIKHLSKTQYIENIAKLKSRTIGKLVVYDDLSGNGNTSLFKRVLDDLKLKKNFEPDVIYVDYLGEMSSSVYKAGSVNTYVYFKSIAAELRQMAKRLDIAIVTAAQLNRTGFDSSDAGMTQVAESFGINFSADLVLTVITSEELERLGQFEIRQSKNRYRNKGEKPTFRIGVDKPKMRLYSLEHIHHSDKAAEKTCESDFFMDQEEIDTKLNKMRSLNFS